MRTQKDDDVRTRSPVVHNDVRAKYVMEAIRLLGDAKAKDIVEAALVDGVRQCLGAVRRGRKSR